VCDLFKALDFKDNRTALIVLGFEVVPVGEHDSWLKCVLDLVTIPPAVVSPVAHSETENLNTIDLNLSIMT